MSETGTTVQGEVVDPQPVVIEASAEQRKADAKGRVGNTANQVGVPAWVVIIGTWVAALCHVDLDPGAGTDMPATVVAAFIGLLTVGLARWMNRAGYSATDEE